MEFCTRSSRADRFASSTTRSGCALRLALGLAAVLASPTLLAGNADLDTTFNGGAFTVSTGGTASGAYTMMLQPDGRAIVGGVTTDGVNSYWTLVRLTPNGAKDTTFGGGTGQVVLGVGDRAGDGGYKGYLNDLVIQPNGKIIGVGRAYDAASSSYLSHLVRWLPDGSIDPSFGNGGDSVVSVSGMPGVLADYVALQGDGKIVVAGEYDHPGGSTIEPVVLRYTAAGQLNVTFGTGGIFRLPGVFPDGKMDPAGGLAIRPDGRIVFSVLQTQDTEMVAEEFIQLASNGVLDSSFGSGGIYTSGFDYYSNISQFAIQLDGKIVAMAEAEGGEDEGKILVYRLLDNGAVDHGFGNQGHRPEAVETLGVSPIGQTLHTEGKCCVTTAALWTGRMTAAGDNDTAFGPSGSLGSVTTPVPGSTRPSMHSLKMQSDGRFIVAGMEGQILMARYQGDPLVLTPATFKFTNVTGVKLSKPQISNVVTISSLTANALVPITVVDGSYSINGDPFTRQLGYVKNGDQVMVKHNSAATSHTSVTTKLRVGGINDPKNLWTISGTRILATFTSTTQ